MNCIKCNGKFETHSWSGVNIDVCDSCAGIWLDAGEAKKISELNLQELIDNTYSKKKDTTINREVKGCPRCNVTLKRLIYSQNGMEYEACLVCFGVFLDNGELIKYGLTNKSKSKKGIEVILNAFS